MEKIKNIYSVIKFAWNYSRRVAGKQIWLLLTYKTYIHIHPLINAFFIKLEIDLLTSLSQYSSDRFLFRLGILLTLHFIFESWMNFCFRHHLVISRTLQRKLVSGIDIDLAYKHASLPITTIESSSFKDKYELVRQESSFRLFPLVEQSVNLISGIFSSLAILIILFGFSPWYVLIMLVTQIPRILIIKPALKKITHRASVSARLSRLWHVNLSFLESLRSSYETRILSIQSHIKHNLQKLQFKTVGLFEKTELELLPHRSLTAIIPSAGIFSVSFLSAKKFIQGSLTIGDWQLSVNTAYQVYAKLRDIIDDIGSLSEASIFVAQLIEVLDLQELTLHPSTSPAFKTINSIEFDHVTFKYPNSNLYALKDVTFSINARENVAIVGHNGAGKTTLVKLLCRFYQPTQGIIKINGTNIDHLNLNNYYQLVSALFQDFATYGLSAQDSIGFGDISNLKNLKKIKKYARLMGIDSYLTSLPKGYQTPLIHDLKNGVNLSTGQWQKVALTRALFRPSQIIILDEPTSNLDPESEEKIFNQLIHTVHNRIMFLISHRFSTVRHADRILVIDNGKLIQQGTHQLLIKKRGLYAKLFKLQSKSFRI